MPKTDSVDHFDEIVNRMGFPKSGEVIIRNDGVNDYVELDPSSVFRERHYILYSNEDEKLIVGEKYPCSIFKDIFVMASFYAEGKATPQFDKKKKYVEVVK